MDDLEINNSVTIPAAELSMSASRSGGPGGQHANKTSSRVTIEWNLTTSDAISETQRARLVEKLASHLTTEGVMQVSSNEERSQHRNRELALARLANLVREGLKQPKRRKKTRPSRASKERRLDAKKRRAATKRKRRPPKPDDWK